MIFQLGHSMLSARQGPPSDPFHRSRVGRVHFIHFDAGQDDASATKILEAQHRPGDAFDRPVILLYDVVRILDLADLDRRFPFSIELWMAARLAPLFPMVTVSGTPFWPMAFSN
jgi:hypothetical protein